MWLNFCVSNFILNNSSCILKVTSADVYEVEQYNFSAWAQIAALWCTLVCDQCCLHKWTPEAILKQKFSALIPIFISYHLFKTSGKYMYKNSCCPRIPCFWLFLCDVHYVPTKYMKFKRLFKKCLFQSCSCMLLQSFLSKGKKNQNPYLSDWLQSFIITCE